MLCCCAAAAPASAEQEVAGSAEQVRAAAACATDCECGSGRQCRGGVCKTRQLSTGEIAAIMASCCVALAALLALCVLLVLRRRRRKHGKHASVSSTTQRLHSALPRVPSVMAASCSVQSLHSGLNLPHTVHGCQVSAFAWKKYGYVDPMCFLCSSL